jgi:WD40 repeat protein
VSNNVGKMNIYNVSISSSSSSSVSLINSFQAHTFGYWVVRIKQCPFNSNLVATSGQDWTIKIWNVDSSSSNWTLLRTYDAHFPYEVYALEWLDADTIASGGNLGSVIKIWSVSTGETKGEISVYEIMTLKLLTNKIHLVVGSHADIQIHDISNNGTTLLSTLTGHINWVRDLVQLDEHTLASCSHDQTVRIWNLKTNECKFVLEGHRDRVYILKQITTNHIS